MGGNIPQDLETVTQKVTELSEIIDKYGSGIVAVAIIYIVVIIAILGLFLYLRHSIRKGEERTDQFIKFLEESANHDKNNDIVKSSIESTNVIIDHLKYLVCTTKCDRAVVYMFHNGQFLLNGSHLMKFSCFVEFALISKYSFVTQQRDIPIGQIQDLCTKILNKEPLIFEDLEREEESPMHKWCKKFGMKSVIAQPVYNKEGYILGFVAAEYYYDKIDHADIDTALSAVHSLADKVSITMDINSNHGN